MKVTSHSSDSRRLWPAIAALAILLSACGVDEASTTDPTPPAPTPTVAAPSPPTTEPTITPTPSPAITPAPAEEPTPTPQSTPVPPPDVTVHVYWAWTIPTTPGNSPERMGAGGRVAPGVAPAAAAMEALLAGPNPIESEIGMMSTIPPETELLGVVITGGVATVDLSSAFEQPSGTLAETLRVAQVVFTLTQFDSVQWVRFRIEGEDRTFLGSHGIDVSEPVDRGDFEAVRPLVLVEQPYPGASFGSGDRLVGESNTFEANVQYVITDGDGLILAEGFTTASAGNGVWGRFDVPVVLDSGNGGRGTVIVFETSAKDGAQINVVEYPIQLSAA